MKAKQNTYASKGERGEVIFSDSAKELVFEEKDLKYRDRYFGPNPFIGQEIVFQNKKAIWGMNYYGQVTSKIIPAKKVYQFLRKALRRVTADKPFRGPANFTDGAFQYINKSEGTVESFKGSEKILYKGKQIYQLHYHGGRILKQ